jgi:hypothetical protein
MERKWSGPGAEVAQTWLKAVGAVSIGGDNDDERVTPLRRYCRGRHMTGIEKGLS